MIINNLSTYGNSRSPEILAYAQTISNHFIDAIEQNDCTLKVVIGFYFEVDDSIHTAKDLTDALVVDPWDDFGWKQPPYKRPPSSPVNTPDVIVKTPEGVEQAVQALKNKCFNCKLRLPKIKFEKDFRFIYNKLTFQLEIFKITLPSLKKPSLSNYCHMSFAFQKACIPDILKFIGMLLMALSAIMALNKLPRISLGVFVKAIIGKLIAAVIANIKLSIDMSQTGLPCILAAIEEIANAIPTKEDIYNLEMSDEVRDMLFPKEAYTTMSGKTKQPFVPRSVFIQNQDQLLTSKQITREEYDKNIREYSKKNEPLRHYARQLREQTNMAEARAQAKIEETFAKVSDVVTRAQDEVNAYLQSLLGVLDFFECESTRSGPDFSELIEYINKLQEVINFTSSILGVWLAKIFKPLLCLDNITHKDIEKVLSDTNPPPPLSNTDIADIIEEFTGKQTDLAEDGVTVLIYDKPAKRMLPKLSLLGCNLKEFAESHTIDNLIPAIVDFVTDNDDSNTKPRVPRTPGAKVIRDIPRVKVDITRGVPVRVPPTNYYKPIPVPIPPGIRDIPVKIPPTLIDRVRRPIGSNIPLPLPKNPIVDKLPPVGRDPLSPGDTDKVVPPFTTRPPTQVPPYKIPPVVGIIDKIKEDKDDVDDVIDRIPLPDTPPDTSIPDEIDDLIDFIYNPPTKESPKDEYVDVRDFPEAEAEDDFRTSTRRGREGGTSSSTSATFQRECKTFDDVLDILSSLKI